METLETILRTQFIAYAKSKNINSDLIKELESELTEYYNENKEAVILQ